MISDSLLTDSLTTAGTHPLHWSADSIAMSGMMVVFAGLVLIALTIFVFNLMSKALTADGRAQTNEITADEGMRTTEGIQEIPADHLIAIGTAVELYRRLHLERPSSRVTFVRGEEHSPWKTGVRYGQRQPRR